MQLADVGPSWSISRRNPASRRQRPHPRPSCTRNTRHSCRAFSRSPRGRRSRCPTTTRSSTTSSRYSKPNDFDLGLYAAGQTREVAFQHPGVVKLYCSIHESMNGTIFAAPTPFFDVAGEGGHFTLRDVPPGYPWIRTWNEKLPDTEHSIVVPASGVSGFGISLVP